MEVVALRQVVHLEHVGAGTRVSAGFPLSVFRLIVAPGPTLPLSAGSSPLPPHPASASATAAASPAARAVVFSVCAIILVCLLGPYAA